MTVADLSHILPLIILAAGAVVAMLGIAIYRSHLAVFVLTLCTLVLSLVALGVSRLAADEQTGQLIRFDGYAVFFAGLLLAAAIAVVVMSYGYMRGRPVVREEFYILLLTAVLGSVVLVSSIHLASLFIGLELLSASLYVLIAYNRSGQTDVEAGIKYLVPAATSSAFLLFGMAIIYAQTGTMSLPALVTWVETQNLASLRVGAGMILTGLTFKLALVPFHFWAADVYEGAPAPVAAFIATVSKGAAFVVLLRYFAAMQMQTTGPFPSILTWVAIVTMVVGNYLALQQRHIKRLLAYSSIAHMGYLLVAFLASGPLAMTAAAFYLLAYFITILGAFGVVTALSSKDGDLGDIEDCRGLAFSHPILATVLTATMFSLAGIPLTAGFLGKFYLVLAGVQSRLWLPVLVLVANSVVSLFYYLRIILALHRPAQATSEETAAVRWRTPAPSGSFVGGIVLAALLLSLIWVGVYPGPIIRFIESLTGGSS